jgi:hypothetical protein
MAEIIAKALKKDRRLQEFDPTDRDRTIGCFIVVREAEHFVLVDESGLEYHRELVGASTQVLHDPCDDDIRGGRYSKNEIPTWEYKPDWDISMSSVTYGEVWPEIQNEVKRLIIGEAL